MEVPGLADQGRAGVLAPSTAWSPRIVVGRAAGAPGHAEGAQPGPGEGRGSGEEGVVGRVGARPAALDIVDPQAVELDGDGVLVGRG